MAIEPTGRSGGSPATILGGREDRLFPLSLQERGARQRLGLPVRSPPGGHLLALSQPGALDDAPEEACLGDERRR